MNRISGQMAIGTLLLALMAGSSTSFAQSSDQELRDEIEALKKGQEQIQKELQEIKKLLQTQERPAAPSGPDVKGKVFDIGSNPMRGEQTAKVTLVEFTDYQ
jgi:protein-disulfide isomerase